MEIYHTSPVKITEINKWGRFGEFLCFAGKPYKMTACKFFTYKIDIDEDEIISASKLFYHPDAEKLNGIIEEVMSLLDCDEDESVRQIEQRAEYCGDAEKSWDIQALSAKAGKILGYRGVAMPDEQGICYMIDMLGMEAELILVE